MPNLMRCLLLILGFATAVLYTFAGCRKKGSKGTTTGTKQPTEGRSEEGHDQGELNPPEMDHDLNLKTAVELVHLPRQIQLDVLSFLKHTDVERYRLVSHHTNSTVVQLRDQLHLANRRVFSDFKLRRMTLWKRTNKDGLIDGRHIRESKQENWLDVSTRLRCCRGLKQFTDVLIGQRIYIGTPAHTVVCLEVVNEQGISYVIGMRNELSSSNASYQLIHFLKHLSGTVFTRAEIETSEQQPGSPNPQIFRFTNTRGRVQIQLHYQTTAWQLRDVGEAARQALDNVFTVHQAP